jgi:predicted HTH domain antitoxin
MTFLKLDLPENLRLTDFDLKMMIASKLFDDGQLTSGQAAKLVGISKRTFIEVLGKYNVSIFGYDFSELEEDLDNA